MPNRVHLRLYPTEAVKHSPVVGAVSRRTEPKNGAYLSAAEHSRDKLPPKGLVRRLPLESKIPDSELTPNPMIM